MKINKKKLPIDIAISIVFLYSIMPWVGRLISSSLTLYFYLLILIFVTLNILVINGKASLINCIYVLLPFLAWRVFELCSNASDIVLVLYQSLIELIPVILGIYILKYRKKASRTFVFIIISAFVLTTITTIRGLTLYPNASRWLATASSAQDNQLIMYDWMNIGGYNFVYSLVLIYPILILAYKKKKVGLLLTIVSVALIFVLLVAAGYTTALLLFGVSSLLFFFNRDITKKEILIFITILLLLLVLANTYLSQLWTWLADVIDNENISYRLTLLAGGRTELMDSNDNRLELYGNSLKTFLQNPMFGKLFGQDGAIGGHSFILDYLANYGMFGAFFLVFMYRRIYFTYYKPYQECLGYGFLFWSFVQTIAFSFVNTGMWLYVLTLYIPCCVSRIFNEEGNLQKYD